MKRIFALSVAVVLALLLLSRSSSFLVMDAPAQSDVMLVLAGGRGDWRYWRAVQLLQKGYANRILLDVDAREEKYGKSQVGLATEFLDRNTPGHSEVCPI